MLAELVQAPQHPAPASPCPSNGSSATDHEDMSGNNSDASAMCPSELRCSYRSKPCHNIRATKVNGDLHKLCAFHRQRANVNQQRVHLKKRIAKKQSKPQQRFSPYENVVQELPLSRKKSTERIKTESFMFDARPIGVVPGDDLSMEDLQILEFILAGSPEEPTPVFSDCIVQMPPLDLYLQVARV
ncbi:hypothetical protein FI667_g7493, partial [Globisporangium splendens]